MGREMINQNNFMVEVTQSPLEVKGTSLLTQTLNGKTHCKIATYKIIHDNVCCDLQTRHIECQRSRKATSIRPALMYY